MPSPLLRVLAAGVALAGLTFLPGQAPAQARTPDTTPLTVTIDQLTPSAIPAKGRVTVSGTVTNNDSVTWLDVGVYPFISSSPMTTVSALDEAAATEADAEVGARITTMGDFETFDQIAPGQTVSYTLVIPRKDLGVSQQGVYWFGVHALGSGPNGFDHVADGRARTFLPFIARSSGTEQASVVVPIRGRVIRKPDGSLDRLDAWANQLSDTGRLGRLAEMDPADAQRLSWLVDPAVLDAIEQLAAGDRPRNLGRTVNGGAPTPTASPAALVRTDDALKTVVPEAKAWLDRMLPVLKSATVLALPYGDLDLAAAAAHGSSFYQLAFDRSHAVLAALGIDATDYNAPIDGLIDTAGLSLTDPTTPMLVSDQALPKDLTTTRVNADHWHLVVASSAAASGGPEPGDTLAGVAMRQRVLAEAAVRLLDPAQPPLVVAMPTHWPAYDAAGFASGLDVRWLSLSSPSEATAAVSESSLARAELNYPATELADQLGANAFDEAGRLVKAGRQLQAVLSLNDQVAAGLTAEALTSLGYPARGGSGAAAETSYEWVRAKLDDIQVQAPPSVTLSGSSGRFAATIVNDLAQPITVGLQADPDPGVRVRVPKTVQVDGHSRRTVLLTAHSKKVGLHNVTLHLTDPRGALLPAEATVPVRSAQVSGIIWAFIGVGGTLLFGAIGVRIVRRVRSHHHG